jgi:hypothetical protein
MSGVTADERAMLLDTAREILGTGNPVTLVAELVDAGIEVPALAGAVLELQGELLARSTVLDAVLAVPAAAGAAIDRAEPRSSRAERAARAVVRGLRVVLPLPGGRRPPGRAGRDSVEVDGLVVVPEGAEELLVHTSTGALVVPVRDVVLEPISGFDPELGATRAHGTVPTGDLREATGPAWDIVVDTAAVAVAHELVGVGQRALDIAVAHVREREQFGAALATLQSVRHALVGAHVELEAARAGLSVIGVQPHEIDALAVKVAAGRAALGAVAVAQQLCGAMGFTAEHGLHRSVRRALLLDGLLGGADDLEIELGALLAARGTVPLPAAHLEESDA